MTEFLQLRELLNDTLKLNTGKRKWRPKLKNSSSYSGQGDNRTEMDCELQRWIFVWQKQGTLLDCRRNDILQELKTGPL